MKVVFDTNVLVSALLWRGAPYRCLLSIRVGLAELCLSPPILAELRRVLKDKFAHTDAEADDALRFIQESSSVIEIPGILRVVTEDPDDDKFIETARLANAQYVVSGDRHLLRLRESSGVKILTARAFLDRLAKEGGVS